MGFGPGQVHGINDEPDIGRVLAGLASPWDFNELDGRFVECTCIGLVSVPVGISFLDNQLAFFKQSFEHFLDFETCLFLVGIALGQVFEVNKNGQIVFAIRCISRRDIHEVGSRSFRIQSNVSHDPTMDSVNPQAIGFGHMHEYTSRMDRFQRSYPTRSLISTPQSHHCAEVGQACFGSTVGFPCKGILFL